MLEKAVGRTQPSGTGHVPEIIRDQHRDCRQASEAAGAEPSKTIRDDANRPAQLDGNGESRPKPPWSKSEVIQLGDGRAIIQELR